MTRPTPEHLRSLLEYDPTTGLFRWRRPTARQAHGWFKGNKSVRAYRRLYIEGHHYLAHVIAWVIEVGEWPKHEVGHRNRDHGDNRWTNLRPQNAAVRAMNRRRGKNNTTGFRGVSQFGDRFRAAIHHRRRRHDLGLFDDAKSASFAWRSGAAKHYGDSYDE